MIASIVLHDRYSVGVDRNGKFVVDDTKMDVKDVPFVRYRFSEYNVDSDIEYILRMMEKFRYSVHMIEVNVEDGFDSIANEIISRVNNLACFLYISITDNEVENGFSSEQEQLIAKCSLVEYDRIMLKDNSDTLYSVSANRLKKEVSDITGENEMDIGICSSPLSFGSDACLTAMRARELAANYGLSDETALPSANHECMNCCGCIRYIDIKNNIPVVTSNKPHKKSSSVTKKSGAKKVKVSKSGKKPYAW